jgi:hypothetical protein
MSGPALVRPADQFKHVVRVSLQAFNPCRVLAMPANPVGQGKQGWNQAGGGEQCGQPAERLLPEIARHEQ